jgi:methylenetetrahydrofolate dehydrogenase (NADP+)/methenyltetrahydrofolate cyclohydrolase
MVLLEGKIVAAAVKQNLAQKVAARLQEGGRAPHLAAILVGNNPASEAYVGHKVKACSEVGFESTLVRLPETTTETELLAEVAALNENPLIDGFIVQLPLPDHIDSSKILLAVAPEKDVDGFHPINIGRLALGLPAFVPATPLGILYMLEHYQIPTAGKHVVVIGRSNIVGTPMSLLLSRNAPTGNATVTLCHSRTVDIAQWSRQADIVVVAIGKPHFLTADMVKTGAVVIDVGINQIADASKKSGFRLVGDVDFEAVSPKCSYITPVPGGVGVMTVVALLANTWAAAVSN